MLEHHEHRIAGILVLLIKKQVLYTQWKYEIVCECKITKHCWLGTAFAWASVFWIKFIKIFSHCCTAENLHWIISHWVNQYMKLSQPASHSVLTLCSLMSLSLPMLARWRFSLVTSAWHSCSNTISLLLSTSTLRCKRWKGASVWISWNTTITMPDLEQFVQFQATILLTWSWYDKKMQNHI